MWSETWVKVHNVGFKWVVGWALGQWWWGLWGAWGVGWGWGVG